MNERNRPARGQDRSRLAFTLIELLVVVAILGILAAVVIPALLGRLAEEPSEPEPGVAASAAPSEEQAPPAGVAPVLVSADIRARITAREARSRSVGISGYAVAYEGQFVLEASEPGELTRLSVPLPSGAEEAEDVALILDGAGYSGAADASQVRIDISGVHWTGLVPRAGAEGALTARVAFTARGKGRVVLDLPDASEVRSLTARVELVDLQGETISAGSLEPKAILAASGGAGTVYTWSYKNLVSGRPIIIELPVVLSPLARTLFMLRLVGLALFLFGCGFWYLVEGYEAGRLSDFRWRHFLLLGLTYSLFFAIFVVCGFQGVPTLTALLVSAGLSLPLLIWHTASIVDWRFAAKYTLPLVTLTTGLVVNGVYGGELRSMLFLAAAAFIVAYLTFTMEGLVVKQADRRARLEADLKGRVAALEPLVQELTGAEAASLTLLGRRKESTQTELRALVTEDREAARALLDQVLGLDRLRLGMVQKTGAERRSDREAIESGLWGLQEALQEGLERLVVSCASLAPLVEASEVRAEEARARKLAEAQAREGTDTAARVHCIDCGHGWEGSRHCPQCGSRRPDELTCGNCATVLPLPVHLFDPAREPQQLFCPSCGECHSGVSTEWFTTT